MNEVIKMKIPVNKPIIYMLILILILGGIMFIPIGVSENIETPFGQWIVEVEGTTPTGQIIPFSTVKTIGGQLLSWTTGGQTISHVNVKIYAQATGSGYDYCDIDLGTYEVVAKIYEGGIGYSEVIFSSLGQTFELPVNGAKVLIFDISTDLSAFESRTGVDYGDVFTIKFLFRAGYVGFVEDITFCGRTSDGEVGPWQTYSDIFTINTDITLKYEDDYVPSPCNQPYPGNNCQSNPSECGVCNAHLSSINAYSSGAYVASFGWGSSSSYGTCDVIYHYYDVDHWSSWEAANTNDHIEVFRYRDIFAMTSKPTEEGVLRAYMTLEHPTKGTIYLEEYHVGWDNDKLGMTVSAGEWCNAYFHTNKKENHLLLSGGGWALTGILWYEPTGTSPQYYDLTVQSYPCSDSIVHVVGSGYDETIQSSNNVVVFPDLLSQSYDFSVFCTACHPKVISVYLDSDKTITVNLVPVGSPGFQVASKAIFSITIVSTGFEKYEHNGNYLGRL
jgi:hypothetical protein